MNPSNFLAELKRRNVYKVAVAYAIVGWLSLEGLAQVYTRTNEPDRAIELSMPSYVNYARLKLHPMWNPLRGDPRFERIVNSLAPIDQSK